MNGSLDRNELNHSLPGPLRWMGHASLQLYRRQHEDTLGQTARVHLGHVTLAPCGSHPVQEQDLCLSLSDFVFLTFCYLHMPHSMFVEKNK